MYLIILQVLPEYQAQLAQQARVKESKDNVISDIFARYDFIETSYHFWCQKIDLHLSDDPGGGYVHNSLIHSID